ncbi:murein hydrolase activator EnvC [Streptomyces sp. NBC_01481]|uniref:murein hydrolase activator EnvC family protein n=1 Tax=Streptomyces sp. NBC_01481 TaxID=2975869 RepID=UPI002252CC8B|nr:M23 family metallopeptidase [Streptomyces sp. NBC_01481]MCX4586314.1 M23 family metallopeptidase [Streptomyces sp. NBC_01481]
MKPRSLSLRKISNRAARACLLVYLAMVVASFFAHFPYGWTWIPLGLWVLIGFGVNRRAAVAEEHPVTGSAAEAVEVAVPVTGRWKALNSPADKVPSHGTRAYGQAYAIDIVAEPGAGARPRFGWWPLARRSEAFPAFGADVLAVADATVVHADDRQRDHLSRTSWLALLYFFVLEAIVRSLGGARRVIGNHVILDLGDGTYALYAHLRRGSLTVRPGDRVRTGQPLGRCGNSGNSTEPHLHFQLMDGADPNTANGTSFTWRGVGVPRNGETFEAAGTPVTAPCV